MVGFYQNCCRIITDVFGLKASIGVGLLFVVGVCGGRGVRGEGG